MVKRQLTYESALARAASLCSRGEHAEAEMRRKLRQAVTAKTDYTKHGQRHRHRNDDHQADVECQRQIEQRHRTAHSKHSRLHRIAQLDRAAKNRTSVHKILRDKVNIPLFA